MNRLDTLMWQHRRCPHKHEEMLAEILHKMSSVTGESAAEPMAITIVAANGICRLEPRTAPAVVDESVVERGGAVAAHAWLLCLVLSVVPAVVAVVLMKRSTRSETALSTEAEAAEVPDWFLCPIARELMRDPVCTAAGTAIGLFIFGSGWRRSRDLTCLAVFYREHILARAHRQVAPDAPHRSLDEHADEQQEARAESIVAVRNHRVD